MPSHKKPQLEVTVKENGTSKTMAATAPNVDKRNDMRISPRFSLRKPAVFSSKERKSTESTMHVATDFQSEESIESLDESTSTGEEEEQDPLLELFRVHNTNRVKFDLTPKGKSEPATEQSEEEKASLDSKKEKFSVKKFIRSSSQRSQEVSAAAALSSKGPLNLDDEDEIIKKMLSPSPLARVTSLLSGFGGSSNVDKSNLSELNKQWQESSANIPSNNKPHKPSKELIALYLKRAQRHHKKYRYQLAMKYYLIGLKEMQLFGYSDSDPLMSNVLKSLNDVHHAKSTLENSASIVKMGIQHEDRSQLVKALKLYTIAYRMRRDSLGVDHPSLPVLLNMMGSVQVKRGAFSEAMQIYELGLKGRPDEKMGDGRSTVKFRNQNPLTTSVTLRDMGMILEHLGEVEKALRFYHASLRYAVKFQKGKHEADVQTMLNAKSDGISGEEHSTRFNAADDISEKGRTDKESVNDQDSADSFLTNIDDHVDEPFSWDEVRVVKSTIDINVTNSPDIGKGKQKNKEECMIADCESGEMELFLEKRLDRWALSQEMKTISDSAKFYYDGLFVEAEPLSVTIETDAAGNNGQSADADIAMTLHQIGQIHRRSHRHAAALSAYNASLRGMKQVHGSEHAHIAAILGNIGNLYMETGDNDEAFAIYQEVLGIETLSLGLSHPEIAVTLHNIATIECSRGNFSEGVSLYKQVVEMQKIRFGQDHLIVAMTLGCLADAYERAGKIDSAIQAYGEALKIRTGILTKFHLDVGRLMHKLGRLASCRKDYVTAMAHVKKATEIYAINNLPQDHLFMREMARDHADIQAGLAFDKKWSYYNINVDDNIDATCDC